MNELLFFVSLLVAFTMVFLSYKYFGKTGLFAWIAFACPLANIEAMRCVTIFGLPLTLGNALFSSIFLSTDVLSEKYGLKESKQGTYVGIVSLVCFVAFTQLAIRFKINDMDFSDAAFQTLFGLSPRICLASLVTFCTSGLCDSYLYYFWKKILPSKKWLWVRNNGSTMFSQIVDSLMFTFIAFYGEFSLKDVFIVAGTTYVAKWILAFFDTPFLYIIDKFSGKHEGETD